MNHSTEHIIIAPPADESDRVQMMNVRVAAAELAYSKPDWPAMYSLRKHYSAESNLIADGIKSKNYDSLCAKLGCSVVGMCVWKELDDYQVKIQYLYVVPGFQRQKIGGLLFDTALQLIGASKSVQLTTQSAQKFYEKRGFVGTNQFVKDRFTTEEIMTRIPRV